MGSCLGNLPLAVSVQRSWKTLDWQCQRGHAEKVYRSLLMNEYVKAMAKTGTVGVADYVMKSILEIQEAAGQEVL